jgi:catechol 2,3-dioxygenase-like lactoylglutathione lyase family enzyme
VTLHGITHINIRVPESRLADCREFYCDILGLAVGPRPPFSSTGYWLYAEGEPVVHLVAESSAVRLPERLTERGHAALDHVAFRCTEFSETLAKLEARGIAYRISTVPGLDLTQVNFVDPVGVGIELAFEAPTVSPDTSGK